MIEMNGKLYLISDKWEYAIKLALEKPSEEDAICLLQDAVYFVSRGYYKGDIENAIEKGVKIYVIGKDIRLRGLDNKLLPGVKIIGYPELIDLIFSYRNIINL